MIRCSLGTTLVARVVRALSGYTYCKVSVPVTAYSGEAKFAISVAGGPEMEYTICSTEYYSIRGDEPQLQVLGMLSSQTDWALPCPVSYDGAMVKDALKSLGISGGTDMPVSFMTISLNRAQLAVVLANMGPEPSFVDFERNVALRYSELARKKPINTGISFHLAKGAPVNVAFLSTDTANYAEFPDQFQSVLPFGQAVNLDRQVMANLASNFNELSGMVQDLQSFTSPSEYSLGDTVMSSVTYDRKVIVAAQSDYYENASVHTYYVA